jgi:hypothetical protein
VFSTNPFWLGVALFGAACYGAAFPIWGLVSAKNQNALYQGDPARIRAASSKIAVYYVLLGCMSFISSMLQFYGIAQVLLVNCRPLEKLQC